MFSYAFDKGLMSVYSFFSGKGLLSLVYRAFGRADRVLNVMFTELRSKRLELVSLFMSGIPMPHNKTPQ